MNQYNYGLIGQKLAHSFSSRYFHDKFIKNGLSHCRYDNYEILNPSDLPTFLAHTNCNGLNVTIPYKQSIIPFLDTLDDSAKLIGAVNTIKISNGIKKGYNTDYKGFELSLKDWNLSTVKQALIIGTGGSSKAIHFALERLGITVNFVSREKKSNAFLFEEINQEVIQSHQLIVNCTPLGMWPSINESPPIPFKWINKAHFVYDLIYNPEKTIFLEKAEAAGAKIKNGLAMLEFQAEEAWKIWNE